MNLFLKSSGTLISLSSTSPDLPYNVPLPAGLSISFDWPHLSVQQEDANTFLVEAELGRDLRDDLARFVVARRWGLLELKLVTITLEDVFLRLTQEEPASESVLHSASHEGGSETGAEVQV